MALDDLSPSERSLRARIAAHTLHSRVDSREHTAPARAASPGQLPYWERVVDPDNELPERERRRRAEQARKAHMASLALKSARSRRQRRNKL
jgi:hypothetical protein